MTEIESISLDAAEPGSPEADEVGRIMSSVSRAPSPGTEPNRFYEWSIKRLERRVRILGAAVAILLVATLSVGVLNREDASTREPAASPSAAPIDPRARAEVSALRRDLGRDLKRLRRRLDRSDAATQRLRREVADVSRCLQAALTSRAEALEHCPR
jgi:hypothetical protein